MVILLVELVEDGWTCSLVVSVEFEEEMEEEVLVGVVVNDMHDLQWFLLLLMLQVLVQRGKCLIGAMVSPATS